jgi:hypothetical protein
VLRHELVKHLNIFVGVICGKILIVQKEANIKKKRKIRILKSSKN